MRRLPVDPDGRAWPRTDPGNQTWEGPWRADSMRCSLCNHFWAQVAPVFVRSMTCPSCGYINQTAPE